MSANHSHGQTASAVPLDDVLEEIARKMQAGEAVDLEACAAEHPDLADDLRRMLPVMALLADFEQEAENPGASPSAVGTLGDFRLIREVGRGGMGVVYEAEQISLGRRVALKVLPFASTLDAKQLQRFKNEAQAAAHLHHQSIVPVYATGCERGVHFYAMQFIEGQTLANVIAELHTQAARERATFQPTPQPPSEAAQAGLTGPWDPNAKPAPADPNSWPTAPGAALPPALPAPAGTKPIAAISTERSTRSPAYCRTVAQLGVQAAEALEHAHEMGVVHRDIKPANLLVDGRGHLWVTDFGLAHCQSQAGLTMSGDLVGTLRYMSPEQALAKRVIVDHRTDIYSLGATLYELLTLEPAFPGRDRQELLKQIAFDDPRPSRRLNAAIPNELETIVSKAMEKNPTDRYATAQELADDLQRFLKDEPIRARRPTLWQRAMKWARRNRAVVWSAGVAGAVLAVLTIIGLLLSNVRITRKQEELDQANRELVAINEELITHVYIYRIALAERALAANQAARAEELLGLCPPEQRGWEWHFLERRIHEEPQLVAGHTNFVSGVVFSSNGQMLASSGWDGTVRLWDAATGKQLRTLTGKSPDYAKVAISPDGRRVAAGSWDATVTLWDLAADEQRVLTGHKDRVVHLVFSPDGSKLASASHDQTVCIWDLRKDECKVLTGHAEAVQGVAYNRDGTRLASASVDQSIWIWETESYQPLLRLTGHAAGVWRVAFSPDGTLLASAGMDRTVRVWDASTGARLHVLRGHSSDVNDVAFSPDGQRLVSAADDATVRLWDPRSGQEIVTLRSHSAPVQSVAFSPDGHRLASAGFDLDMKIRIWNATPSAGGYNPKPLRTIAGHRRDVNSLVFSRDGRLLASGSRDNTVRVYEAATGQPIHTFRGPIRDVSRVAFSWNNTQLAAVGGNGILQTWNVQTGQAVLKVQPSRYSLDGVTYAPDGKHLALGDYGSGLRLLNAATGDQVAFVNGKVEPLFGALVVAYSPDGQTLAAACDDEHVRLWDMKTKAVRLLRGHQGTVAGVAFRPDGRHLASAGYDGWVVLWDMTVGKEVRRVRTHNDVVNSVAYSQDGKRLATGSRDGTVKFWDAAEGSLLLIVRAQQGEVFDVAFHPRGSHLASAGADGTVKIWEAPLPPDRVTKSLD